MLCCTAYVMVADADAARRCHGHYLCTLYVVVVGAACGVAVVVAVAVFMPCVVVAGVVCGIAIAVFAYAAWGHHCH